MKKKLDIEVKWISVSLLKMKEEDYISLTDIAKHKSSKSDLIIQNWMRNRNTIEYLWLRETINNEKFKPVEFEGFKKDSWLNAFLMSPAKWIKATDAVGVISKPWRYWWTYAHKDIAIKFANRISVEFELYLIKEFQRLKEKEHKVLDRDVKRFLTKMNYKIHTDAINQNLIPKELLQNEINIIYANEADILNKALFWMTAKQRKDKNIDRKWLSENIRDCASIEQLIILANIESMNAKFIEMWLKQPERLKLLNQVAITQMQSLLWVKSRNNYLWWK